MLTDEDKAVLHYLRQSPRDPLKAQAADLIERLAKEVSRKTEEVRLVESKWRAAEYFARN